MADSKITSEMRKLGRSNPELAMRLIQELTLGIHERSKQFEDTVAVHEGILTATQILLEQDPMPSNMVQELSNVIVKHFEKNNDKG